MGDGHRGDGHRGDGHRGDGPGLLHRLGGLGENGNELAGLIVGYLKQETLGPLRGLARFVVFGVAGSVALSGGTTLLLLAVLRALQGETGTTFSGDRSWLPYLITAVVALAVVALAVWRTVSGASRRRGARTAAPTGR
ncbi:MAG: hypothetical protein M0Z82_05475 [Actinomycetota bacterium]|nr:hypothetical protein [Actinomycetota bacterium]